MKKIKTIFIVGPTASGKTALSIELAKKFGGEIVCADSMQIYKGIHIASAAPCEDEKCGVKHHLFEFLNLDEQFSVADYVKKANEVIKEIASRGKLPIVVGGTGLYISSLLQNIQFTEEKVDNNLRVGLEKLFDEVGAEEMLRRLAEFDPETAARLHPNNRRRIIRAFEVYKLTGKTLTEQNEDSKSVPSNLDSLVLGITYKDRELLYNRINKRVDIMLENGLLEEARKNHSISTKQGAFQAIGHKEFYPYFENEITFEEATEVLKRQTRRYAKRQLTWFTKEQSVNWVYPDAQENIFDIANKKVEEFLIKE